VVLLDAEVVVDHLDHAGTAVTADRGTGPQASDPLAVPDHRPYHRGAAHQEHADQEQDHVKATMRPDPHPRHAVHDPPGPGGHACRCADHLIASC
jgi:hypothetical protein